MADFACKNCGLELPLRNAGDRKDVPKWQCMGCEKTYRAYFDLKSKKSIWKNVRPALSG